MHTIDVNVTGIQPAGTPVPSLGSSPGGSRSLTGVGTNLTSLSVSGNGTIGGDLTVTGAVSANGSITDNGYLGMTTIKIAPTPATTATPALLINNSSVGSDSLVVNNWVTAATPVFKVGKTGTVNGYVLQYGSTGQKVVCNETTITGTGTLATGLATPSVVTLGMGADANYDHNRLSFTNAAATVTVKIWNGAATPAAAATGVPVDWCAVGKP
jgi:hypothetical protein